MINSLPNNYRLNARYTILHQIGQGGFGITYKAHDTLFDRVVCIKELFLSGNSRREESLSITSQAVGDIDFSFFKNKFLEEAQKLATFDHPNIVKVLEYFEANNTAYMVMEFVDGKNLKDFVKERNRLDESEALPIFSQLMDATKAIHEKSFLHRDIKPDNVLITPQGKAVLIDFGTAKFHDSKNDNGNTSTLVLLSHGYAPPEQYSGKHKKGNYTDIYALGATLYFMLTGEKPEQATDRTINELKPITAINPNVSKQVESAVIKAMELIPRNRYQQVGDMEKVLKVKQTKAPSPYTKRIDNIVKFFLITLAVGLIATVWKNRLDSKPTTTTWNELSSEKDANEKLAEHERLKSEKERIEIEQDELNSEVDNGIKQIENLNYGSFKDYRDGKTYKTIKIGNQVWMAENLAYKSDSGNYWAYDNELKKEYSYGYLYDWKTGCKVCPNGWHLPSNEEWAILVDYLGGENIAGKKMKSVSNWKEGSSGTNLSGFSAQPGESRVNVNTAYLYFGAYRGWWSSSANLPQYALAWILGDEEKIHKDYIQKTGGLSVRCLKN